MVDASHTDEARRFRMYGWEPDGSIAKPWTITFGTRASLVPPGTWGPADRDPRRSDEWHL